MSREAPFKADKDFSETLNEQFPQIDSLASSAETADSALNKLLVLEKQTRQASDLASSKRVLCKIVDILADNNKWSVLNEQLILLSKKHGQMKLSVQCMIQEAIDKLDAVKDEPTKISVIETIRTVTENKIFVEVERARVTRTLSKIKLLEGDLDLATELLSELQVETYGSMELKEKLEFILEQMQLNIQKGDFEPAKIISRKILEKNFNDNDSLIPLKKRYFELKIKIFLHEDDYLEVARYYLKIYDIDSVKNDKQQLQSTLINIVYFIILAPYDNLQHDLIHKVYSDKNLQNLPESSYYQLVKCFIKQELIRWPSIESRFGSQFKQSYVFNDKSQGEVRLATLRDRVIEHNLRIISTYYSSISIDRLNELLHLNGVETERYISKLVYNGVIFGKINRPERIVSFSKPADPNGLLNEWSRNVEELLDEIEVIGHLITKDEILSQIKA